MKKSNRRTSSTTRLSSTVRAGLTKRVRSATFVFAMLAVTLSYCGDACSRSSVATKSAQESSAQSHSATKTTSPTQARPARKTFSTARNSSVARPEHLPSTSLQIPFAVFKNAGTIVSFKYPRNWQPQKAEDKDTIIRLSGTADGGLNGEISLGKFGDASVKAETARHIVEDLIFAKLENFKKIQQKTIAIGPNRKLVGYLEDVSFKYGGMDASQRWVFFDSPLGTYYLTFTAPVAQFNALMPIYNEVLTSVSNGGGGSGVATASSGIDVGGCVMPGENFDGGSADASAASSSKMTRYQSPTLPVTFSFPAGWAVEDEAAGDKAVTITGKNKEGQVAEFTMYRGSSLLWTTTEELADMIEKEFYQPQDSFRRVNRQSKEFGNMSKLNGILQENSFKYKGQPVKQLVAIFEHDDKAYALSFISPGWKESEMRTMFHRVLATMSVKD